MPWSAPESARRAQLHGSANESPEAEPTTEPVAEIDLRPECGVGTANEHGGGSRLGRDRTGRAVEDATEGEPSAPAAVESIGPQGVVGAPDEDVECAG